MSEPVLGHLCPPLAGSHLSVVASLGGKIAGRHLLSGQYSHTDIPSRRVFCNTDAQKDTHALYRRGGQGQAGYVEGTSTHTTQVGVPQSYIVLSRGGMASNYRRTSMNYDVKLKAIRLVHRWYDDCPAPVVMSTACLDLLLERVEEALREASGVTIN